MVDTITLKDGRTVGYADYGRAGDTPVLWCHGGPGSRLEPAAGAEGGRKLGFRIIGIDRPGYGASTAVPGRTIADWVPDALAVLDHLKIDRFLVVGVSTGGAYSLAVASATPRVDGVIACCALTDMSWADGKNAMARGNVDLWSAPNRDAAIAMAEASFGRDGTGMLNQQDANVVLAEADLKVFSDPAFQAQFAEGMGAMFAQGVVGYVDDRLADGPGWGSFDVGKVRCPVTVLHGGSDNIVPVMQAHHTAKIVPGAKLVIHDALGHFSIIDQVLPAILDMRGR